MVYSYYTTKKGYTMRQGVALTGILLLLAAIGLPALIIIILIGYMVKGNN